ncbi:MAG: hypothetical protein KDA84_30340, partial [Planctomycetaceae bacterium]|nr:hypothetical protein [Planctomycetaceae bacterium]
MIPRHFFRQMLHSLFGLRSSRRRRSRTIKPRPFRVLPSEVEKMEDRTLLAVTVFQTSPEQIEFQSDVLGGNDDVIVRAIDGVLEFDINGAGFTRDVDPSPGVQEFLLNTNSRVLADINGTLLIDDMTNAAGTFFSLDDLEILPNAQISTRNILAGGDVESSPSIGHSQNIVFQAPDLVVNNGVRIFAGVESGSSFNGGDVQFIARAAKDLTWDSVIPLFNDVDASASITLGSVAMDGNNQEFLDGSNIVFDAANIIIDAETTTSKFAAFEIDQEALVDLVDNEIRATFTGDVEFDGRSSGGDTITRATGSWLADGFKVGQILEVSNSRENDNTPESGGTNLNPEIYRIANVTDTVITLTDSDTFVDETAPGVTIQQGAPRLVDNPTLTFSQTGSVLPRLERLNPGTGTFPEEGFGANELLNIIDANNPQNNGLYRTTIASNEAVELNLLSSQAFTQGMPLSFVRDDQGPDRITREEGSGSWLLDGFQIGSFIEVRGTTSNNTGGGNPDRYQVIAVTALELTLAPEVDLEGEVSESAIIEEVLAGRPETSGLELTFTHHDVELDTITRAEGDWFLDGFRLGSYIEISGTANNNTGGGNPVRFQIVGITATELTLDDGQDLQAEVSETAVIQEVIVQVPLTASGYEFVPADFDIRIDRPQNEGSFVEEGFLPGQTIFVEGSQLDNDGTYTIAEVTATSLRLSNNDRVNDEANRDINITTVSTALLAERVPLVPLDRDGNRIVTTGLAIFAEDVVDNLKVVSSKLSSILESVAGVGQGNITDASSEVRIGNGAILTATGDVRITALTDADVTLSSPGLNLPLLSGIIGGLNFPIGAGFGVSEADASAIVGSGASITAGGVFNLDAHIDNKLAVNMSSGSGLIL